MPLGRHPRRTVVAIALAMAALVSVGAALYRVEARRQRDHVYAELGAVARLKVAEIVRWREDRLRDGAELLNRPGHASRLLNVIEHGDPADAEHLRLDFRSLAGQGAQALYHDIAVVDAGGHVRVALRAAAGSHEFAQETARASLADGRSVLTDLARPAGGPPRISVVVPIGGTGAAHPPRGALVLVCDPETSLYRVLRERTSDARSAETFLVRREGADALYLSPRRHEPGAALRTRFPLDGGNPPAVRAALGQEGTLDASDERGTPVFSVSRRVPGTSWGLVSTIDQAEALAPLRVHLALFAVVVLAFAGATGAWLVLRRQARERRHYAELYRAELEQRVADAGFRELFEHSPVAYQSLDQHGRLLDLNQEWSVLFGYPAEEALGRPFGDFWSERTRPAFPATFERFASEGRMRGELELRRRDGSIVNVVATGRIQRDADGRFVRTHCIFTDITARALAEEALRERVRLQEQLAQVAAAVPGMMYSLRLRPDGTMGLPYVTDAVRDVFGFGAQDLDHDASPLFTAMHPDDALGIQVSVAESAVTLTPWHGYWRHRHPAKGERWIEARSTPQREADGSVVWHGFAMDVTEQRAAEAEREKLHAQLLQAQKMESVGRLAGGIAHDFNNMLGVILGHAALALEDAPEGTALRSSLQEIESAAQRSAELTRQLLAFARRQTVAPRVLDLNATIGGMRNMLARLIGEDVELAWRPGDGLWPVRIDPVQVDQLLANLCINARDAITGGGRITIETANTVVDDGVRVTHPGWSAGEYVRLSVSDDGCGMDPDVQQRLFEPFFTTKPTGRGTGLGLATVYGIVTQNDGQIAVHSEKGHGTTFRIYLPRSDRPVSADEPLAPRVDVPVARGETILLVEDEPAILRLEEEMLRRLGYEVLAAAAPGDALRLAAAHPGRIDLVMTDVVMPGMNGRELAEEIARARPGVRCLYMSGYTADVIAHRGVLDDGVNFLQKPFALRDLAERVRGALRPSPASREA